VTSGSNPKWSSSIDFKLPASQPGPDADEFPMFGIILQAIRVAKPRLAEKIDNHKIDISPCGSFAALRIRNHSRRCTYITCRNAKAAVPVIKPLGGRVGSSRGRRITDVHSGGTL
jgi:hypothetical protein